MFLLASIKSAKPVYFLRWALHMTRISYYSYQNLFDFQHNYHVIAWRIWNYIFYFKQYVNQYEVNLLFLCFTLYATMYEGM